MKFQTFIEPQIDPRLKHNHVGEKSYNATKKRPSVPFVAYGAIGIWLGIMGIFACVTGLSLDVGMIDSLSIPQCRIRMLEDSSVSPFGCSGYAEIVEGDYEGIRFKFYYDGDSSSNHVSAHMKDGDNTIVPPDGVLRANEYYEASLSFSEPREDLQKTLLQHGCQGQATIEHLVACDPESFASWVAQARRMSIERISAVLSRDSMGYALLMALVFGDRSNLDNQGLYDSIKILGLAHLVAVSGAHLSIVTSTIGSVLTRLGAPRKGIVVILCAGMGIYALFTGCGPSVIRSALMACIGLSAVFCKRRSSSFSALCVCVCIMLAFNPSNAFSLSFALSVLSTAGIIIFTPLFSQWLATLLGRDISIVSDVVAMTSSAQLFTAPLVLPLFGRVVCLGIVAHMIAAVFLSFYLPLSVGLLCLGLLIPPILRICCFIPITCAQLFCEVCTLISRIPASSIPVDVSAWVMAIFCGVVIIGLWVAWPQPTRKQIMMSLFALTSVMVLFIACCSGGQSSQIVVLDIGQGDAVLIKSKGQSFLVDTGRNETKLLSGLARHGVYHLDGCLITHHDMDHYGALHCLRGTVPIDAMYVADDARSCPCESCQTMFEYITFASSSPVYGLEVGDVIHVGDFELRVIWPYAYRDEGGNDDSVCLLVLYDGDHDEKSDVSALLMGDAECDVLDELIAQKAVGDIDIYKVGHHGSRDAITPEQAEVLRPEYSLVSAGAHNRYGHPAFETLEVLDGAKSRIIRTDKSGDIMCVMEGDKLSIQTDSP